MSSLPGAEATRRVAERARTQREARLRDTECLRVERERREDEETAGRILSELETEIPHAAESGFHYLVRTMSKTGVRVRSLQRVVGELKRLGYTADWTEKTTDMGDSAAPCLETSWVLRIEW